MQIRVGYSLGRELCANIKDERIPKIVAGVAKNLLCHFCSYQNRYTICIWLMGKSLVRECKTGSTGKPAVISLTKRNYLTRVFARVLDASDKCG